MERKDSNQLFKIVWQKNVVSFMRDWSLNSPTPEALIGLFNWCMGVSDLKYLILTIDCANEASCKVVQRAGFELFEKRYPLSHKQANMESDCYYYFRKYRN